MSKKRKGRMMRRARRHLDMKPPTRPAWAGEPNAREMELNRQIEEIESQMDGKSRDEVPLALIEEYGRLHRELLMESQRRSGLVLIDLTPTDQPGEFRADLRNLLNLTNNVLQWVDAGIPYENAVVRALEDEHWRQEQESKAA
jgi:hypothetical protein